MSGMIKIFGHVYTVNRKNKLSMDSGNIGECHNNTLQICTDADLAKSQEEEVLLHEILEALKYRMGLTGDGDFPHKLLEQISEGLYSVMSDNPHVFSIKYPDSSVQSADPFMFGDHTT